MSTPPQKVLPAESPETAEFWAACRRGELWIQQCGSCGRHQFYPRVLCTACSGRDLAWVRACGRATVRSYTVVRRPVSEAYAADVPYVVALVLLEEGPTMMTHVVACPAEAVRIDMPVEVTFREWADGVTVPVFRPAG